MPYDSNAPANDSAAGISTPNGTVTFLTSPLTAAQQAAADAQFWAGQLDAQAAGAKSVAPLVVAGIIGAVATAAGAAATVANAAVGLAGLVRDSDGDPAQDALEIEIFNNTSQSVVPYNYTPAKCDFTEVAQPLIPTAMDSFLLTSGSVGRFSSGTNLELDFMIGSSANAIAVAVSLNYSSGKTWGAAMTIDSKSQSFAPGLNLTGAQFIGNAGFPSFSLYVTPIESTTGKITVAFYDTQS